MSLRLPSHTTEFASVPTLVHINCFLSLYPQSKSNPNQTGIKTKLDNGVKTRQLCFTCGLWFNTAYGLHWAQSSLWSPENCNCYYFMRVSKVCESQSLNSPVSQPSYSSTHFPIQDATLKMHLLVNTYLNMIKFKQWNWNLANKIISFHQQQSNICHALDIFASNKTRI